MRMLAVAAMAVVHEQMHQRAGQQKQVRQYSQQVRTVLHEQEEPGNRKKTIEHPTCLGKVLCFMLLRHAILLPGDAHIHSAISNVV